MVIYKLCTEREEMVTKLLGYDAANKIVMVESMEDVAFSKEDVPPSKPFQINTKTFSKDFTSLVAMLGDMEFSGLDSETYKNIGLLKMVYLRKAEKLILQHQINLIKNVMKIYLEDIIIF